MKVNIKKDLQKLFSDFKWKMKSIINSNGKVHPIPRIPQVITGLFEDLARRKIVEFARENYKCEIIEAGSREYPEVTLTGARLAKRKLQLI